MEITARVSKEYFDEYEREGPVLTADTLQSVPEPDKPVIDFVPGEEI